MDTVLLIFTECKNNIPHYRLRIRRRNLFVDADHKHRTEKQIVSLVCTLVTLKRLSELIHLDWNLVILKVNKVQSCSTLVATVCSHPDRTISNSDGFLNSFTMLVYEKKIVGTFWTPNSDCLFSNTTITDRLQTDQNWIFFQHCGNGIFMFITKFQMKEADCTWLTDLTVVRVCSHWLQQWQWKEWIALDHMSCYYHRSPCEQFQKVQCNPLLI